ncbi:hypothetical protein NECID01_0142 [Nematocida sp. AWRm77]|nr:hypothetical protein NECID01_0142 [Nematocida sp. AWRm77]
MQIKKDQKKERWCMLGVYALVCAYIYHAIDQSSVQIVQKHEIRPERPLLILSYEDMARDTRTCPCTFPCTCTDRYVQTKVHDVCSIHAGVDVFVHTRKDLDVLLKYGVVSSPHCVDRRRADAQRKRSTAWSVLLRLPSVLVYAAGELEKALERTLLGVSRPVSYGISAVVVFLYCAFLVFCRKHLPWYTELSKYQISNLKYSIGPQ